MNHKAALNNVQDTWPPNISNSNVDNITSKHEWVVTTGDTSSKVCFSLFTREESALLGSSEQSGATGSQSGPKTGEATDKPADTSIPLEATPKGPNDNGSD